MDDGCTQFSESGSDMSASSHAETSMCAQQGVCTPHCSSCSIETQTPMWTIVDDVIANCELELGQSTTAIEQTQSDNNFPELQSESESAAVKGKKHSKPEYTCEHCQIKFSRWNSWHLHDMGHRGVKLYDCGLCGKQFLQEIHLEQHLRIHSGEKKPYACPNCDQKFAKWGQLTKHSLKHSGGKPHECLCCGERFEQTFQLKYHLFKQHKQTPFTCPHCDRKLPTQNWMTKHSEETPHPHGCPYCEKTFVTVTELKSHQRLHRSNDAKPFKCESCEQQFARRTTLDVHIRTKHTLFACPNCDKTFLTVPGLKAHATTHSDLKPFMCDWCARQFARKSYLVVHTRRMHALEIPFACLNCDKKFTLLMDLETHNTKLHGAVVQLDACQSIQPVNNHRTEESSNDAHSLSQYSGGGAEQFGLLAEKLDGAEYAMDNMETKFYECRLTGSRSPRVLTISSDDQSTSSDPIEFTSDSEVAAGIQQTEVPELDF